jgi:hypothetical protein
MVSFARPTAVPVPPSQARRSSAIFSLRHNAFDKAAATLLAAPTSSSATVEREQRIVSAEADIKLFVEPSEVSKKLSLHLADSNPQPSTAANTDKLTDESSLPYESIPVDARRLSVGGAIKRASLRLQRQRSALLQVRAHSECAT